MRKFIAVLALVLSGACVHASTPNGSTDGRYHTCGYVTDEGVTSHLNDYKERCSPGVQCDTFETQATICVDGEGNIK